ncbi:hypothetical protein LTS18_003762 [Coniosporium uncinatum]|uniref:Uncharacterized protein n=1 Tax=Coniosporium uncinatum TaxID=93489 RepID=A0ACC3DYI8_9PEZI|nr:hypothetical protein LTS18_003762 [Coniosporium uncinatum]
MSLGAAQTDTRKRALSCPIRYGYYPVPDKEYPVKHESNSPQKACSYASPLRYPPNDLKRLHVNNYGRRSSPNLPVGDVVIGYLHQHPDLWHKWIYLPVVRTDLPRGPQTAAKFRIYGERKMRSRDTLYIQYRFQDTGVWENDWVDKEQLDKGSDALKALVKAAVDEWVPFQLPETRLPPSYIKWLQCSPPS